MYKEMIADIMLLTRNTVELWMHSDSQQTLRAVSAMVASSST